jgi:hypothetical protein
LTENAPARPGRITRWRLAEPVRFYFALPFLALVVHVAALASAGEWLHAVTAGLITAAVFGAVMAARASVYSEPAHVSECLSTAQRVARGELIP